MTRLSSAEVHLVMHGLDVGSRLRLARCSRRLLQDAQHPFAWLPGGGADVGVGSVGNGGTLEIELSRNMLRMCCCSPNDSLRVEPDLLSLHSSPLLRHVPLRLHVLYFSQEIDVFQISRLQRPLYALNCSAVSLSQSMLSLLSRAQLSKLRWLSLGASSSEEENSAVTNLIAFQLPLLHTLSLLPSSNCKWTAAALQCFLDEECLPQLTSLECGGDSWQRCLGAASFATRLKRLSIVNGYTHEPDQIALNSSNLRGLRELRLERWRNNYTWPNQLAPLQSFESCFTGHGGLVGLQNLILEDVPGIDFLLDALHHLPALRWLRVLVPFEGQARALMTPPTAAASSVPSPQVIRAMMERCPKLEQLHLSITVSMSRPPSPQLSPCVGAPPPAMERQPSDRLCELRGGYQQLPRTTVALVIAEAQ
jgi:hypothetical protein